MYSSRVQFLAFAMLLLCAFAALVLAALAVPGVGWTPVTAIFASAFCAMLLGGAWLLHNLLREARWDAGLRLR